MTLADCRHATGTLVWAHVAGTVHEGKGRVIIRTADPKGIDQALATGTTLVADELGVVIELDWLTLGRHVPHSRHFRCHAWDSDWIYPKGGEKRIASLINPHAMAVHHEFHRAGWAIGEPPHTPGLLLGPAHTSLNPTALSHVTHLHCSIADKEPA